MQTTNSHFKNNFTFTISNAGAQYSQLLPLIESNAVAVISYLSDFIQWNGTLDFVVSFGDPHQFGHDGSGLLPSYGGIAGSTGNTYAAQEAFTGIDANGGDYDAGSHILPNQNGTLTNYGAPLYFDPSPDPYELADIPAGSHDFFSIYLHEVLHALGFWSTAQHAGFGQSAFDRLTSLNNGQYQFTGNKVVDLLGEPLKLATMGSRDHYTTTGSLDRGAVFEWGNYEQNRWHLGKVDLAVLADLGWTTANGEYLPLTEQPDDFVFHKPGTTPGPNASDQVFQGGTGVDSQRLSGKATDYVLSVDAQGTITVSSAAGGTDRYLDYERLVFDDKTVAFDIDGNAGQAYRLYQAAFDRVPDNDGLKYWIGRLDAGDTDLAAIAESFLHSPEFVKTYGTADTVSNSQYVELLYLHTLGRDYDVAGYQYWVGKLDAGETNRGDLLAFFSESQENKARVGSAIDDGIWLM
jgi:hypothetical protein